ncbi:MULTISPECIES: TRAP transporter substrate-binding protein [unclassified Shinella]|uniref:TRAP transporter substrate-binding protein n=2 Tax=Shinella TaxID=323620 RepID=UPI00234EEDC7|nr:MULTISPECIES: TRAP transporter substrate-binding protein [unclassified Shinella]MDC7266949.1 TRAP transporter substrate-binding protein [Shinella sp. HY16]MDC7273846.1 TRAP transporter substrate-binding protein [Shinella sp. YZ44]
MHTRTLSRWLLASMATLSLATSALAADVSLKFGVATPSGHPHSQSAIEFAKRVAEKTGGAIEVKVFDNGSLGSNPELLDGVKTGAVDFTISTPGVMGEYSKGFGLLEVPYIFASKEHMMKVTRGEIGARMAEEYKSAAGIEVLGYLGGAQRNMITTKTAIRSMEDLKGLKMRTAEVKVLLDWWNALGATGSVVAFPEVYTAMQTGVVDGAENEFTTFTTARWAEIAKNIALTEHAITVRPLVGNAANLAKLSQEQQSAIRDAAREVADWDVELEGKLDEENKAKLAADFGVTYTTPDKAPMLAASSAIIKAFADETGVSDLADKIAAAAN